MEDIVDRLRVLNFMGPWKEAADEIERLREALKYIATLQPWESQSKFIIEYAIDKLKEKE
jgi:hypothetical protein